MRPPRGEKAQHAFRALADPTRRDILIFLSERDMTIGDVVECFDMTRAAVKKHLVILEQGGLISVTVSGRQRINRLRPIGMQIVLDWLDYFDQFWDENLRNLKRAVEKPKK